MEEGDETRVVCRGNRTEVVLIDHDGALLARKRLLSFADVSTERRSLHYEGLIQRAARGPGVVPIRDERFEKLEGLSDSREESDEIAHLDRLYVPGHSLKDLLHRKHRVALTRDRCRGFIATLLSTLNRVHRLKSRSGGPLGLVHRDVTLGNVIVGDEALRGEPREGNVWLNDFGLAYVAAWGPLPLEETLQGSRRFLSPELKAGQQPTAASDIYQAALLLAALINAANGGAIESLFAEGFSNPVNEKARKLLAEWGAEDAVAEDPSSRPRAAELAALLLA